MLSLQWNTVLQYFYKRYFINEIVAKMKSNIISMK